jgi:hypothetical protein
MRGAIHLLPLRLHDVVLSYLANSRRVYRSPLRNQRGCEGDWIKLARDRVQERTRVKR